jgi:NTE family protein
MGKIFSSQKKRQVRYYNTSETRTGEFPFTKIVIEGGGMKIVPVAGTIRALYTYGILKNIKYFAGTSAGSIIATALACGFTPDEIDKLVMDTDFSKFKDDTTGFLRDGYRLTASFGLCPGDYFLSWIEEKIASKLGKKNATFTDLFLKKQNRLYISSLCVEDDAIKVFSYENTPDMVISKSVRMSMSIPLFFCPVKHEKKHYVDGGVSNNYPINMFDKAGRESGETLGIKLMSPTEEKTSRIYSKKMKCDNIVSFSCSILSHILNEIERREINENYWNRTLSVDTGTIGILEFNINNFKKNKHIKKAYSDTMLQLEQYKKNKKF